MNLWMRCASTWASNPRAYVRHAVQKRTIGTWVIAALGIAWLAVVALGQRALLNYDFVSAAPADPTRAMAGEQQNPAYCRPSEHRADSPSALSVYPGYRWGTRALDDPPARPS